MLRAINKRTFIERARDVHGNKYGYDEAIYLGSRLKVKIFCYQHQSFFLKAPNAHLEGQGCPKCGNDLKGNYKKMTINTFIKKSRIVHGGRYSYDEVIYLNNQTKVKIFCYKHSSHFEQIPISHLRGHGCNQCAVETRFNKRHNLT